MILSLLASSRCKQAMELFHEMLFLTPIYFIISDRHLILQRQASLFHLEAVVLEIFQMCVVSIFEDYDKGHLFSSQR